MNICQRYHSTHNKRVQQGTFNLPLQKENQSSSVRWSVDHPPAGHQTQTPFTCKNKPSHPLLVNLKMIRYILLITIPYLSYLKDTNLICILSQKRTTQLKYKGMTMTYQLLSTLTSHHFMQSSQPVEMEQVLNLCLQG